MSLEQLEEFQFLRREVQWVRDHWAEANPEVQGLRQEVERLRAQIQVQPEGGGAVWTSDPGHTGGNGGHAI